MSTKVSFTGVSRLTVAGNNGDQKSKLLSTDIFLEVDNSLDKKQYLNDGLPNAIGTKCLTQTFIQGLTANIRAGHAQGYWDKDEHLKYVISELSRSLDRPGEVTKGIF